MRLDGNLEDFGLPDVLNLLARTHKSGALHLNTEGGADAQRRGVIRLGGGSVNAASSDLRRQALARRIVGAGLVSDEALAGAAEDVRAGAPSLVRALLDRAAVDHDEVTRLAADQATDAVCELLRWSAGTFSFMVGEDDPDGLELGLLAEELVAEGERRMQVWPTLTSHIPSPDTVLRLAAAPAFDPSCTREEWGLVALVDGARSVSEIVALLGRSEFAVAGALSALVERGLLTVSAAGSGLADLQRRQDVIAGLESGAAPEPVPAPVAEAAAEPEPEAAPDPEPVAVHSEQVPAARTEDVAPPAAPAGIVTAQAASHEHVSEQPSMQSHVTQGNVALDPARAPQLDPVAQPETAARGLDSAVTKSLVLRLIAGVRGL